MNRLTEEQAIQESSKSFVEMIKLENVDFTNRVTDGTYDQGTIEFSATVDIGGEFDEQLTMYVFVDSETVNNLELDAIDWGAAIEKAEYEIV